MAFVPDKRATDSDASHHPCGMSKQENKYACEIFINSLRVLLQLLRATAKKKKKIKQNESVADGFEFDSLSLLCVCLCIGKLRKTRFHSFRIAEVKY